MTGQFFTLLADLKHPQEVAVFCRDFFSPTEVSVFIKRLEVIKQLAAGQSYEQIQTKLRVSSATISSLAALKDKVGLQLALHKLSLDAWASLVLKKIKGWKVGLF